MAEDRHELATDRADDRHRRRLHSGIGLLAAALLLAACGQQNAYVAPPPPKVTVRLPIKQAVTRYLEWTGNTAAVNSVDLVARVQGFLQQINYQDGQKVKRGTVLFVIEPEPYKVKLEQAQAAEVGAQATLTQTEAEYKRQAELSAKEFASKSSYDQALANRDGAKANLLQAKANTRTAEINYDYTQVVAPFDGIVSAHQVSVGELVGGGGSPTLLATIVQLDPIYVNFYVSERDVLRLQAEARRRHLTREDLKSIPIEVGLQTEEGYPHQGTIDYVAPSINQSTGTLLVRGILKNADGVLLPGYFVRIRVAIDTQQDALLVPETALGSDQGGSYVLVVNADDVVEQRKVETGPRVGDLRVIESGLKADDRVIGPGLARVVPGQKIVPQLQLADAPHTQP